MGKQKQQENQEYFEMLRSLFNEMYTEIDEMKKKKPDGVVNAFKVERIIVAHVHDECIVECPPDTTVQEICDLMGTVPPWAPGLILRADGYECPGFYMKD